MDGGGVRAYARSIEREWASILGRPVILSQRDWDRINRWYDQRIPLAVIAEAIESLRESRARRPPRNLGYVAAAVEQAWETIREGRSPDAGEPAPMPSDPLVGWQRCLRQLPTGSPLASLLAGLLAELESGSAPTDVDRRLERELCASADPALRERIGDQVDRELSEFARRMSPQTRDETRRRAIVTRLRSELGLGRLAPR